ncbi:APA family basic amino acid/polyamine antiporter [Sphingomonas zeicaulis]|uniref:amino acid permease n=1 Tax=Sphingomonas zeicaulis TaxID=1632740 RepID=UPI003D1BADD3
MTSPAPPATATPQGERSLSLALCIALVMGNMIGSGVFLLPAALAPYGWNAVAGWALTIAGAIALAYTLAQLTVARPEADGPTGFVEIAFGKVPSFLIGWSYWVSIWTANVTLAVAAVSYLSAFAPEIGRTPYLPALLAITLVWAVTLINLGGARSAGLFQLGTTILKLVPLAVVLVIMGVLLATRGSAAVAPFPAEGFQAHAVTASAAFTLWALLGFESASVVAAKVENPQRNIPRATLIGTLLTGIIYLVICSGVALMLPADVVAGSDAPFQIFVARYWAAGPALLIALFAAISTMGTLNGWVLLQGEQPLAMARRGLLPAWFGKTRANGTPTRALLVSSVLASIFVLINSSRSMSDLFAYMALLSTSATLWLYLACAAAALKLRVAIPIAALGGVYALWTLYGAGIWVSGLSLLLMAAGLPLYGWARRSAAAQQPAE